MRKIPKKALALAAFTTLLVTGCSSGEPAPKEVGTPASQSTAAPDPGTYNDEEAKTHDTQVCAGLQEQVTDINQHMTAHQEGDIDLDTFHSHLDTFLTEEASELVQSSQEASDSLIPQDTEDFVLTVKFLEKYVQNSGELDGQNVVITDSNTPALDALEELEPVEAFQLQVAATEAFEEEELANADGEEYEHRIFGACYTLGVDVAPNAYNLHFTQETNA